MSNNIKKAKKIINQKLVVRSTLFIPLTVIIFGLLVAISSLFNPVPEGFFKLLFMLWFYGLIVGIIIYIPTIFFCAVLEVCTINKKSTVKTVLIIFIAEAIVSATILILIFGNPFPVLHSIPAILLSILLTQLVRWIWLQKNNRMFENHQEIQELEQI